MPIRKRERFPYCSPTEPAPSDRGCRCLESALARLRNAFRPSHPRLRSDGRATHSSKLDWEHDLDRRNGITAQGFVVIHATRNKVRNHPDKLLAEIFQARERHLRRRA